MNRPVVAQESPATLAEARLCALLKRKSELENEIDVATAEVRAGGIPGTIRLNVLAMELNEVKAKITTARAELETATADRARALEADRKRRFREEIAAAQRSRNEIIEHIRLASLAMGAWLRHLSLARKALNEGQAPVGHGATGIWPHELTALREVENPHLDAYRGWSDSFTPLIVDLGACPRVLPHKPLAE